MRYLQQKPGPFWWTGNIRYFIYFVREVAGILLGLTAFLMLATAIVMLFLGWIGHTGFFFLMDLFVYFIYTLFGASIIHTLTWLHAMPRIMPFTLSKNGQKIVYLILLAFWIGISWLAMITIFAPKSYV